MPSTHLAARGSPSATGAGWSGSGWAPSATRSWARAAGSDDGWLAARGGTAFRERNALLGRLSTLGAQILETPDVEATRVELKRLLMDIQRHVQRLNDLAYDEVEMELGGSE